MPLFPVQNPEEKTLKKLAERKRVRDEAVQVPPTPPIPIPTAQPQPVSPLPEPKQPNFFQRFGTEFKQGVGEISEFVEEDIERGGPVGALAEFAGASLAGLDIGAELAVRGIQRLDPTRLAPEARRRFEQEHPETALKPIKGVSPEQLLKDFRERPLGEQITLGALLDPAVLAGAGRSGVRAVAGNIEEVADVTRRIIKEEGGFATLGEGALPGPKRKPKVPKETPPKTKVVLETIAQTEEEIEQAAIEKVRAAAGQFRAVRGEITATQKAARGERFGRAGEILEAGRGKGQAPFQAARAELAGELTSQISPSLKGIINDTDVDALANIINKNATFTDANKLNTLDAVRGLLIGKSPRDFEISLMRKAFGEELANDLFKTKSRLDQTLQILSEAVNLPRVMLVGIFDMSAVLRQGGVLLPGNIREASGALKEMVPAFFNERVAKAAEDSIRLHPKRKLAADFNLSITGRGGSLVDREEAFMTTLLDTLKIKNIPKVGQKVSSIPVIGKTIAALPGGIVQPAERAFVTFINKLRMDVFSKGADNMFKGGFTPESNPEMYRAWANFVNVATGRGNLPDAFRSLLPVLNGLLFAPRLAASRIELPFTVLRGGKFRTQDLNLLFPRTARAQIARNLVSAASGGLMVMSLWKLMGGEVETDPRSTDFGQGKFGNTRFDVWAGERTVAVTAARIVTGKSKSPLTGNISDKNQLDTMGNFLRNKLNVVPGAVVDLTKGSNVVGEPAELNTEFFIKRVTPLMLQAVQEAIKEDGKPTGAAAGGFDFFGGGTSSFSGVRDVLEDAAERVHGKSLDELGPREREALETESDVAAKLDEAEKRSQPLPVADQTRFAFDQLDVVKERLNDELVEQLSAGRKGKALRKSLQDAKTEMFIAGNALFTEEARANLSDDPSTLKLLRERYWTAPVEENPATGLLDFSQQEQVRAEVLQEAQRLGIDPNLVKERASIFSDPNAQAVMDLWNADLERLRAFWKGTNDFVGSELPEKQRAIWEEFVATQSPAQKSAMRKRFSFLAKQGRKRDALRRRVRVADPDIDVALMFWEYSTKPLTKEGRDAQKLISSR